MFIREREHSAQELRQSAGLLWIALALIFCLEPAVADAQQTVRVSMPTSRPLGYVDASGRPQGFLVDALNAAAGHENFRIDWRVIGGLEENNQALRRGDIDIVAGIDIPERHREFFVTDPWWNFELTILVPAESPIREESDLHGRRLAVPGSGVPLISRHYGPSQIIAAGSATEAAEAACGGAAEGAVIATMFLRELLLAKSGNCSSVGLRALDSSVAADVVLNARHASASTARSLRRALDTITMNGTLASIAARHPPISTRNANRMSELLRMQYQRRIWALSIAAGALIILAGAVAIARASRARKRLRAINDQLEQDLRARELAQAALRNSEARFRALFDSVPETAVAVDPAGIIAFANAVSTVMFRRHNLIGVHVRSLVPELFQKVFLDGRKTPGLLLRHGAPPAPELTGLRGDGTEFPIEVRWGTVDTDEGYSIVLVSDISEHVALHQQLLQAQKLESVGQLAGGVAHDFNNLLTVISGYSEMALENLVNSGESIEAIEQIAQAADRASALTRQLLAFSRHQKSNPRLISLNDLLRNLDKMLRRVIGEQVQLVLNLQDVGTIRADPGQIEQVVVNLAVNARDAMPVGGTLSIETSPFDVDPAYGSSHIGAVPGNYVMLRITDTGTGMTPEVLAHIFEPFFTTKEHGKGTGLGLATVYGIVKQSGGEVLVYSSPSQGTAFKILLPVAEGSVQDEAMVPAGAGVTGDETILVAEDEPDVRRFIARVLTGSGYTVLEAGNGRQALDLANSHQGPIHLLLSDVIMPELSGVQLATEINKYRPETLIAHMSGYSGVLGPDTSRIIEKPFTASTLLRHIRTILNSRPDGPEHSDPVG
jgi:PAS domain S-box-containing protein